jgi:Ser/Thr protein kinase RdoA (MazF antagonist)
MDSLPAPLGDLLMAFGLPPAGASATRPASGLIQTTYLLRLGDGRRLVAQRHHAVFDPDGRGEALLADIDMITAHLAHRGLPTPQLLRRPAGPLGWRDAEGKLWRLSTFLDGVTIDRVDSPARAAAAAALVARFHRALADCEHEFAFTRPGAHDTAAHLARLAAAADAPPGPAVDDEVRRLAGAVLDEAERRPRLPDSTARITHGDLKISNVLFAPDGTAHALVDLDTLGRLTIAYEMGDALRSWCNPVGEDSERTRFDLDVFSAAITGYAAAPLDAAEQDSMTSGLVTVALELASRFCLDAFEDRYFGWDATRFPSRREHNRVRAAGQLALARAVLAVRAEAETIVASVFGRPH